MYTAGVYCRIESLGVPSCAPGVTGGCYAWFLYHVAVFKTILKQDVCAIMCVKW
jgi:hypothetical protein